MVLMLKLLQLQSLTASDLEDRAARARNLRERSERKVSSIYIYIYIFNSLRLVRRPQMKTDVLYLSSFGVGWPL